MQLYAHQIRAINEATRRVLIAHSVGCGKTATAIGIAKRNKGKTLVVCPKGLRLNWPKELSMWEYTADVVTKEEFKKTSKELKKYDNLIIDESHWFFGKSAMNKALSVYLKKHDPNLILLTGTPKTSQDYWPIYRAALLLGHKWEYLKFRDLYYKQQYFGQRCLWVRKEGMEARAEESIRKIASVVSLNDCADVPEQQEIVIETGETKEQLRLKSEVLDIAQIARFTAEHKIECAGNKMESLLRFAEENKKIMIVTRYRDNLKYIVETLRKEKYNVYEIHGDVITEDRQKVIDSVEIVDECIVVATAGTCEGYSLSSIPVMIFVSMDFSYKAFVQMKARIQRINALKKNIYIYLIGGACDKKIYDSMMKQKDFDPLSC